MASLSLWCWYHFSQISTFTLFSGDRIIACSLWKMRNIWEIQKTQRRNTVDTLVYYFQFSVLFTFHSAHVCLTEEVWLLIPFQEEKSFSSLPFVTSVINASDLYVGGEAETPGVLPGSRKRNTNCPANP